MAQMRSSHIMPRRSRNRGKWRGLKLRKLAIGDLGDGLQKVGQMLYDWQDEGDANCRCEVFRT